MRNDTITPDPARLDTARRAASRLEVVWAIVLLQGAILCLVTLESLVANAVFGFLLIANLALTAGAAIVTLVSARGIRQRKPWARRTTLVGEWFLVGLGVIEVGLTLLLAGTLPGPVPLIVTIAAPITVLLLLRGLQPVFGTPTERSGAEPHPPPADDPILGTLLG